jgi:hypothetical protein
MFHFHGLQREQALSLGNRFAERNLHCRHLSRHRRLDLAVVHAMRCAGAIASSGNHNSLALIEDVQPPGRFFG